MSGRSKVYKVMARFKREEPGIEGGQCYKSFGQFRQMKCMNNSLTDGCSARQEGETERNRGIDREQKYLSEYSEKW